MNLLRFPSLGLNESASLYSRRDCGSGVPWARIIKRITRLVKFQPLAIVAYATISLRFGDLVLLY
jgi:hypothetical protein